MMNSWFISAFLLGFLGSFHCIGMCGPLALSIPVPAKTPAGQITLRLLYNFGRILTYSIIGVAAGFIGQYIALEGWQSILSIVAGISVILIGLFSSGAAGKVFDRKTVSFTHKLRLLLGKQIQKKTILSLFLMGMINGLLPCGFVYLALAGALAGGSIPNGAMYMFFFGLGTLPMMTGLSLLGGVLQAKSRTFVSRYATWVAIAMGIFLIWRGTIQHLGDAGCHTSPDSVHVAGCK